MPLSDYKHWNEDALYVWYQEEGRHQEEPPEPDDYYEGDEDGDDWEDPDLEDYQAAQADQQIHHQKAEAMAEDAWLDMYMEDRMSGGGGDVDD